MKAKLARSVLDVARHSPTVAIVRRVMPAIVTIVAIAIMIQFVGREYDAIRGHVTSLQWPFLALALVTSIVSTGFGGIVWLWAIRSLQGSISLADAVRAWCLATPGKYGLGAVGQYIGRIYIAERLGLARSVVLGSLVIELAIIAASGLGTALLLLPSAAVLFPLRVPAAVLFASTVSAVLIVGSWPYLAERGTQILRVGPLRSTPPPRVHELHWATGAMAINWFLFGATLFFLVRAMGGLGPGLYFYFVFSTTLSILLGFIGVTPMGLGVRDVTMVFFLSQAIPASEAAVAVVLHRLATAIAELACAGLAVCAKRRSIVSIRIDQALQ